MKSMSASLAVALFLGSVAGCGPPESTDSGSSPPARAPSIGFEVGEPFPTIAFPTLADATPSSIADFRGKKVILHVFASW